MIATVESPSIVAPVFGDRKWIAIRGEGTIDARRIHRAAEVTVERTPLFRVVGKPEPIDLTEIIEPDHDILIEYAMGRRSGHWTVADQIAASGAIVDHDPDKYTPYTDLVVDGTPDWGYPIYYLMEIR